MITVGCSGFTVPATRYFKEYEFVEIQETHLAVPGRGTVRRWKRETSESFEFAVLGPREVGQEGFRPGKVTAASLDALSGVVSELAARKIVFVAPPEFNPSRAHRAAVKEFLEWVRGRFSEVVVDMGPAWDADALDAIAEETGSIAARDPLQSGPSSRPTAYYRLAGPAGHKSRYEDPAIERLAEMAREALNETAYYVFTNVDMFTDAKRFKQTYDALG